MRCIYICHAFAGDVMRNQIQVAQHARAIIAEGNLPIAPHLYLPLLLSEATDRELAMRLCLALVERCDEVRVFGDMITAGMAREIAHAVARGIEVMIC